ncbi:thermonuclease family protein [Variovorax sp. PAMC26660]|uniref:thermonuclease family protein n=1 Tax=Variovorax sp. PAMC26660 TaxID=2762322 RepID=UPI00164DB464|nr:thermonuclease family protein [Variovorax sp. PAMC26660]QNK67823.1 thermonuclease family protein [Variovorax sp. PAMC26660]
MNGFRSLLLAGLLALPLLAAAEPRDCLVVGVSDGDTITARCGEPGAYEQVKVRINGIDAPEKKQPFGERAKQAMSDLVYMKDIELDCFKTDRYRRSVCKVMVAPASNPDGPQTLDAGLAMITVGMAWWYRAYSREQTRQERGQYEFAETEAKAKRVGLWHDADPVAPWDWRKTQRQGPTSY